MPRLPLHRQGDRFEGRNRLEPNEAEENTAPIQEISEEAMTKEMNQQLKVIGGTVECQRCKEVAEAYCKCGACLCVMHLATHECLATARSKYSSEITEALR